MYALIIVIGMLSQGAGSAVMPLGVTSQIVGKFKNLDECKAAASQPHAGGLFQISLCQPLGESIGIAPTQVRIDPTDGSRPECCFWHKADIDSHFFLQFPHSPSARIRIQRASQLALQVRSHRAVTP